MARAYTTVGHTKIMKYMSENKDRTVTVKDIDEYLRSEGVEVNASTIYRFLNKLSDSGEIMKYVAQKGEQSSFQYIKGEEHNCKEHLHLQCVKCGRLIHMECHFMDEISEHVMSHHGFRLQCESSILLGICKECAG